MEKAGRRKLLLTGFLIILVCNLLLTIVDALQVKDFSYLLWSKYHLDIYNYS